MAELSDRMKRLLASLRAQAGPQGWDVRLESGVRDCERQRLVNPTEPCSYHLSGDAIDISILQNGQGQLIGIPFPGVLLPSHDAMLKQLGGSAKRAGYRWGGDFADPDPNHFDDGYRLGSPNCCPGSPNSPGIPALVSNGKTKRCPRGFRTNHKGGCVRKGNRRRFKTPRRNCDDENE